MRTGERADLNGSIPRFCANRSDAAGLLFGVFRPCSDPSSAYTLIRTLKALMARELTKPVIGDIVAQAARSRRMMIVDIDPGDPDDITVAFRKSGSGEIVERVFKRSALILLERFSKG